jgi:hypothetical protein
MASHFPTVIASVCGEVRVRRACMYGEWAWDRERVRGHALVWGREQACVRLWASVCERVSGAMGVWCREQVACAAMCKHAGVHTCEVDDQKLARSKNFWWLTCVRTMRVGIYKEYATQTAKSANSKCEVSKTQSAQVRKTQSAKFAKLKVRSSQNSKCEVRKTQSVKFAKLKVWSSQTQSPFYYECTQTREWFPKH